MVYKKMKKEFNRLKKVFKRGSRCVMLSIFYGKWWRFSLVKPCFLQVWFFYYIDCLRDFVRFLNIFRKKWKNTTFSTKKWKYLWNYDFRKFQLCFKLIGSVLLVVKSDYYSSGFDFLHCWESFEQQLNCISWINEMKLPIDRSQSRWCSIPH